MTLTMNLTDRMAQVSEILIQLAGTPIPSQQFQILVDYANLVVPHAFLAFCLVDDSGEFYMVFPLVGAARELLPERPYPLQQGIIGRVLNKQRSEIIPELMADPDADPDLEKILTQFDLHAALIVPIRQQRKVLGALYFAAGTDHSYSADDLQIGRLLAAGLASSLETSRLYQRLADEKSTLSAVLTSTQDGVLVINDTGTVLLANPAFEAMFGLRPGAVTGQQLIDHIQDQTILSAITTNEESTEVTLPDGRIAQARAAQVITDFGEVVGLTAVFRDITLFKELDEMKNEFVNTVSHDLKNPINIIMLSCELMSRTGELSDGQVQMQKRIRNTAVYMNELVTELLDLGKIQAGLDLHPETFDLTELIQEVLQAVELTAEDKRQQVIFAQQDVVNIHADKRRIKQVLLNLIGNAIKYTPDEGDVTIAINKKNSGIEVAVTDTGIGIAAQDLPYVFDKFYRVQSKETSNIKGTGLGLAITRSIVEAHNGRIWVNSTVGQGTTFAFSLPYVNSVE